MSAVPPRLLVALPVLLACATPALAAAGAAPDAIAWWVWPLALFVVLRARHVPFRRVGGGVLFVRCAFAVP
jgi:hypothetical protein